MVGHLFSLLKVGRVEKISTFSSLSFNVQSTPRHNYFFLLHMPTYIYISAFRVSVCVFACVDTKNTSLSTFFYCSSDLQVLTVRRIKCITESQFQYIALLYLDSSRIMCAWLDIKKKKPSYNRWLHFVFIYVCENHLYQAWHWIVILLCQTNGQKLYAVFHWHRK